MAPNTKSKTPAKEAPTEPFKRAVAGCLRAIARRHELEVSFAAERPGLAGGKARLPEPPRKLNSQEAAIVRGHADSIALRLACHDPAIHRRLQPGGQQSRAVFEAVEQARSRRSARGACKVWRRTSPRCSTTASTAASSTRSPTGRMHRSRMRSP